ncbi:MAG: hypothetical protein WAV28_09600 [Sedimentisphaerales bacterium]
MSPANMLVKSVNPVLDSPFALIGIGNSFVCKVDPDDYEWLTRFKWYAKKSAYRWYAARKILINHTPHLLLMHRLIAQTPPGMICHHINGDSLDNRRANLQNMSEFDHIQMHSYR